MRAYTIETPTNSQGVAGFVLPGNRVDVILTVSSREIAGVAGGHTAGGGAWTLLQNVEILAADRRLDQSDESAGLSSVTLLVTPDMASKLVLAQTMGRLNLTLRNNSDDSIAETNPVTTRDLIFLQQALLAQEEKDAEVETVETSPKATDLEAGDGQESKQDPPREIVTYRGLSSSLVRISPGTSAPRTVRIARD